MTIIVLLCYCVIVSGVPQLYDDREYEYNQ